MTFDTERIQEPWRPGAHPLPGAPHPDGRSQLPRGHQGSPPCAPTLTPGDPSPNQKDTRGHLHGAKLTAPAAVETRDLLVPASRARVPRGPRSSSFSAPWVSPGTCCLGARLRGPTPLSLLPRRRRRSALRPSATPLRLPRGPGNSQIGRYHPRGAPGEGSSAGAAPGRRRPARLPARGGIRRRRLEDSVAQASRRPHGRTTTLPWPVRWFTPRRALGTAGPAPSARALGSAASCE